MSDQSVLSIGQCASLACLLEVTAPKPGNVHRGADFEDATFLDFAASGVAIGPVIHRASSQSVGTTILEAVRATRQVVGTNTNLGIILLLAPLAAVPRNQALADGIRQVLASLDADDARQTYEAIRLANPGGLGQTDQMDVNQSPPHDLLAAMKLAANRDQVAQQYVTDFQLVLSEIVPLLADSCHRWGVLEGVVHSHVCLLAKHGDSLIARKRGKDVAEEAAARAQRALDTAPSPEHEGYLAELSDLDFWLRADGHRRNPGTTADLITAGLFCMIRDGRLTLPLTIPKLGREIPLICLRRGPRRS